MPPGCQHLCHCSRYCTLFIYSAVDCILLQSSTCNVHSGAKEPTVIGCTLYQHSCYRELLQFKQAVMGNV